MWVPRNASVMLWGEPDFKHELAQDNKLFCRGEHHPDGELCSSAVGSAATEPTYSSLPPRLLSAVLVCWAPTAPTRGLSLLRHRLSFLLNVGIWGTRLVFFSQLILNTWGALLALPVPQRWFGLILLP